MKKKITSIIRHNFTFISLFIVFCGSYFYKIGSFPFPNTILNKNNTLVSYSYLSNIWHNGYFLLYKVFLYLIKSIQVQFSPIILKIPSISFAFLILTLSYYIVKKWHGNFIAIISSLLLISWPLLLHLGRYESYLIIYLLIIPCLFYVRILTSTVIKNSRLYLALFVFSLIILIPGGIWFVVLSLYFNRKNLLTLLKKDINTLKVLFSLILGLFWVPFIVRHIADKFNNIYYFLGANGFQIHSLKYYSTYIDPFKKVFLSGLSNQSMWLPGTPILSGFMIIFFILGLIFFVKNFDANRSKLILSLLILSYLLTFFNSEMVLAMSTVMFFIAISGLHSFLLLWTKQFPVNKIAKFVAYSLISLLIFSAVFYNYRSYFVAWKYNQNTIQLFDLHRIN